MRGVATASDGDSRGEAGTASRVGVEPLRKDLRVLSGLRGLIGFGANVGDALFSSNAKILKDDAGVAGLALYSGGGLISMASATSKG